MSRSLPLRLPSHLYTAMVAHAVSARPNECCGLLGGVIDESALFARRLYPLINEAASPIEYWSEPRGLFLAEKDMRVRGYERLAVYHSHPTSPPIPSRTDLARNDDPNMVHFIISLMEATPRVRAWRLQKTAYEEATWDIIAALPVSGHFCHWEPDQASHLLGGGFRLSKFALPPPSLI